MYCIFNKSQIIEAYNFDMSTPEKKSWADIVEEEEEENVVVNNKETVVRKPPTSSTTPENNVWIIFSDEWDYKEPLNYRGYLKNCNNAKLKQFIKDNRFQWFHAYEPRSQTIIYQPKGHNREYRHIPASSVYLDRVLQFIPKNVQRRLPECFPESIERPVSAKVARIVSVPAKSTSTVLAPPPPSNCFSILSDSEADEEEEYDQ
jgi:hypothetical protein